MVSDKEYYDLLRRLTALEKRSREFEASDKLHRQLLIALTNDDRVLAQRIMARGFVASLPNSEGRDV